MTASLRWHTRPIERCELKQMVLRNREDMPRMIANSKGVFDDKANVVTGSDLTVQAEGFGSTTQHCEQLCACSRVRQSGELEVLQRHRASETSA